MTEQNGIYYLSKDLIVRNATIEDVQYMKDHLQEVDINEIWAVNHSWPEDALIRSFNNSVFCMTYVYKGVPVVMFGVGAGTLISSLGVVWMLSTDDIRKISVSFLKTCRKFVDMMLEIYPTLVNYVHADNKISLNWLRRLGARIEDASAWGADNELFHRFTLERTEPCVIG